MYTAAYLQEFTQEMDQNTIYEIHDPLETVIIMFFQGNSLIIIGPYAEAEWNTRESEKRFASLGIPMSYLTAYELYQCQYSILDSEFARRTVLALIEIGGSCISDYSYHKIKRAFEGNVTNMPVSEKYTYEYVNQRYAVESDFMRALQTGDTLKATAALKKLTSMQQGLGYTKEVMWNETIGLSCLRTIIRIAATQSGLPPIIIDAISQNYAQKLYSTRNFSDKNLKEELNFGMVNELCNEIEKFRKQKYSSIVRKAIYYIQLNLGHTLSVHSIAVELHSSTDHLSKQFKSETGITITNYIVKERTKKAAELLSSTRLNIQDISSYVGYMDNNYFVKVFKSQYGMTPTDYRKKYII